jgi:hypothetical protein
MSYIPPLLPEPPHYSPSHRGSRVGLARIRAAHRPHAHRGLTQEADPRPEAGNTTNLILIWRPFPVSRPSGTVTVPHLAAR